MPSNSVLAAFWNEIFASPKLPVCIGSLLAFRPNPVSVQTAPGVVVNFWNAPETPEKVPNSLSEPVPVCGPTGVGLGADGLNVLPKMVQPGTVVASGLPTAVPVSN